MLPHYLLEFNIALEKFRQQFPVNTWSDDFRKSLYNDYSFYSSRVEDAKLQYGDTIKFLNNEVIRATNNLPSLLSVTEHQKILKQLLDNLQEFSLTEESIKSIHKGLMQHSEVWDAGFKQELIGEYRNIPTVGSRQPLYQDKDYAPHYNLNIIMPSYIDIFNNKIKDISNDSEAKHLLTVVSYFHNIFLNKIHPFADGNGRVCRIIISAILMEKGCPPIFPKITSQEEQVEYITTIVRCEEQNSDKPLVEYLARGMTANLLSRLQPAQ